MYDMILVKGGHVTMESCYGSCSGESCGVQGRSFLTKEEKIEMLKEYKSALEKETKGVSERITKLEKE